MKRYSAIFLVFILFSYSCGSRKKAKQSKVYVEQVATRDMQNIILRNDTKSMEITNSTTKTFAITAEENFTGEISDPLIAATVTTEEKDGVKKKTYTGFKNVSFGNKANASETTDTIANKQETEGTQQAEIKAESITDASIKAESDEMNLDVKRGLPWWILVVIAIIYGVVSYFKGWNPMNWLR